MIKIYLIVLASLALSCGEETTEDTTCEDGCACVENNGGALEGCVTQCENLRGEYEGEPERCKAYLTQQGFSECASHCDTL